MRLSRGIAAWAVLFSCATLATCVFPTERDDSVRVTIEPLPVLVRGDETHATARAWHILAVADSQEIANVTFIWSSDDPLTATVDATGHIVGIKSGTTAIRAAAANFDKRAAAGQIALRVANTLEIDSIRPATVKYGEIVTVYGVGLLDTLGIGLSVAGAGLIPVPFSASQDAAGRSQIKYWLPPPAHTDPLFYIGAGVFGFSTDTVRVIRAICTSPKRSRRRSSTSRRHARSRGRASISCCWRTRLWRSKRCRATSSRAPTAPSATTHAGDCL